MKRSIITAVICFCVFLSNVKASNANGSSQASQHSGKAIIHSVQGVAHAMVGGSKVVSGAIAIPLMISGAVGKASGEVGKELWNEATKPIGTPLEISEDTVTVGPSPDKALKQVEI